MSCSRSHPRLRVLFVSIALLGVLVVSGPAAYADPSSEKHLVITTLSTGPDRVSGGDVLVRIDVPRGTPLSDVQVRLNGTDVTGVLLPDGTSDALIGLVTGLKTGDNVVTVATNRTKPSHHARLEIRDCPIYGPVFPDRTRDANTKGQAK